MAMDYYRNNPLYGLLWKRHTSSLHGHFTIIVVRICCADVLRNHQRCTPKLQARMGKTVGLFAS